MINIGTRKNPNWVRNDGTVPGGSTGQCPHPAENVENLPERWRYYEKLVASNSYEWLNVMVAGNYGSVMQNSPVFTEYNDTLHYSPERLQILRNVPLLLSWDFGRTPCCILMQQSNSGQVRIIREIIGNDISVYNFARNVVKPILMNEYDLGRLSWVSVGDPSGLQRGEGRDDTNYEILREVGLASTPCPTNLLQPRLEAVRHYLRNLDSSGKPSFIVGVDAPMVRRALNGGYQYPEYAPGQVETRQYVPLKNLYSHPMDAVQYGCVFFKSGLANGDGQREDWLAEGAAGQGGNGIGLDMGRVLI